jgi:hypothetical protein
MGRRSLMMARHEVIFGAVHAGSPDENSDDREVEKSKTIWLRP